MSYVISIHNRIISFEISCVNKRHSLKWGLGAQGLVLREWDPECRTLGLRNPEPQDPAPRTGDSEPKTQNSKTWNPGTSNFFIELQNKALKGKKSLTGKRDNAKYPFTHFYLIEIIGFFFARVKVCFLNFQKDSGYPWFLLKWFV